MLSSSNSTSGPGRGPGRADGAISGEVVCTVFDESGMVCDLPGVTDGNIAEEFNGVADGDLRVPFVVDELVEAFKAPGRLVLAVQGPLSTRLFIEKLALTVDATDGLGMDLRLIGAGHVLDGIILPPVPHLPVHGQGEDKAVITGAATATLEQVITQCVAQAGVPVVVAANRNPVDTPVRVEADFSELGTKVREAAESVNLGVNARIVLDGDQLPAGVSVPHGGVLITVDAPRSREWVSWQDTDLTEGTIELTEATAAVGVVAYEETFVPGNDPNQTETRTRHKLIVNEAQQASLGQWAGLQVTLDSKSSVDGDQDPGEDTATALAEHARSTSASATAPVGGPFFFGADYLLGDVVGVDISGVSATAVVTQVAMELDKGVGVVSASVGEPILDGAVASFTASLSRKIS